MALDFFAGFLGGCAGVLVGHPFDTIKVHMQTQDFRQPIYRNTFHCFQTIVRRESVAGLYRGVSSPMGGVAIINAIVFGVYGNVQRNVANPEAVSTHLWAGAAAGLAQSFVCCPMELAKSRMQLRPSGSDGPRGCIQCLLDVGRREGWRQMWRGMGATAARDSPAFAIYFASFECMSRAFASEPGAPLPTSHVLAMGGTAGAVSWLSTFPVDVVKSRLQVDGMDGTARRYAGFWDCSRQGIHWEGYAFLSRGLASTLLRAFPMNAATFAVVTCVLQTAKGKGSRAAEATVAAEDPGLLLRNGAQHLYGSCGPEFWPGASHPPELRVLGRLVARATSYTPMHLRPPPIQYRQEVQVHDKGVEEKEEEGEEEEKEKEAPASAAPAPQRDA